MGSTDYTAAKEKCLQFLVNSLQKISGQSVSLQEMGLDGLDVGRDQKLHLVQDVPNCFGVAPFLIPRGK